ncbi:hypothetical protein C8J57DRAFT_1227886 [Mycena rebaudengoi]|nr:hypothetical protein C8J57DRAFT_1227886 [Mycena rebaudengoi]
MQFPERWVLSGREELILETENQHLYIARRMEHADANIPVSVAAVEDEAISTALHAEPSVGEMNTVVERCEVARGDRLRRRIELGVADGAPRPIAVGAPRDGDDLAAERFRLHLEAQVVGCVLELDDVPVVEGVDAPDLGGAGGAGETTTWLPSPVPVGVTQRVGSRMGGRGNNDTAGGTESIGARAEANTRKTEDGRVEKRRGTTEMQASPGESEGRLRWKEHALLHRSPPRTTQVLRSPGQIKLIGLDPRLHGAAEWRKIQKASMEARGAGTRDLTPRPNNTYKLAFGVKQ